ncbi:hypothetical protein GUITHDRAFT_136829 [Guillardia theta CCMP2712]|uniref:PI3K/PI4K catalytic domain-containing protein n=1 Tax=Guillardia theta (strain CCMP2712) TaxID=905079 RepID=L1JJ48_GUITC|nr:hypothetical protein GUITHDRAFT_136829 [Guillardia theta CCMP2712]EKX48317.1 hypothetical protein GUITHDRAFT_136829 [Guillardia theta CCMP2712]|eukprot:XP_005835297.1 hypothetical protein GUITHDRAFT_136829 [Guillardia theta CCMP2712]
MTTCSESVTICGIVSDSMIRDVQEDLAVDQSTVVAGFLTSTSSQGGGEQQLRWCLIEMNTNTRQQILTSQFINAMKLLLARGQVEIILAARNCLPFAEDRAVIELQLNFSERTIKNHDGAISHRFEAAFGPSHSPTYQAARASFIQSYAGSFLLSYFLHVKDQSNRLVFDDNGVHCLRDIFFPLDPAPASSDRTALSLIVKGFLVVREQQDFFVSLVSTFLQRHPHLKRDCLDQLRDKFLPGKVWQEKLVGAGRKSEGGGGGGIIVSINTSSFGLTKTQASLWANEAEN